MCKVTHIVVRHSVLQSGIPIEQTREVVIRCLIDHLGEDACALIKDYEVGIVNGIQGAFTLAIRFEKKVRLAVPSSTLKA